MSISKSKGQVTIPIMTAIGAIFVWCAGLSVSLFNQNGAISGLTATVADIKENTSGFPTLKAEIDWLAKQRGYIDPMLVATSTAIK